VRNGDGCLEVVVSTIGGEVWHRRQAAPNQGWSEWQNLGRPSGQEFAISPPALGVNASGRPEAFVEEEDQVWHASQQVGLAWSAWSSLGQPASDSPSFHAVAANPEDGLELFTLGTIRGVTDDTPRAIWHRGQRASGEWSPWSSLGAPAADALPGMPEVFRHPDGRLELFTMARDGAVWHRRQSAPGGSWSAWSSLGSAAGGFDRFRSLDVGATVDGRPLVVATTGGNASDVWQRHLTTADNWSLVRSATVTQESRPDKKVYELTLAGREGLQRWVDEVVPAARVREGFLSKLVLAWKTQLVDPVMLIDRQRRAYLLRLRELNELAGTATGLVARLAVEASVLHVQADLKLLEYCEQAVSAKRIDLGG
jgi:hypothetical protein